MSAPEVEEKISCGPKPEDIAPEVDHSSPGGLIPLQHDEEGLQVIEVDSKTTVERIEDEKEATGEILPVQQYRRRRWLWACVALVSVIIIALAVGLGVHFGMKSRQNNSSLEFTTSTTPSAPMSTTASQSNSTTVTQTTPITATMVLATADPSDTDYGKPGKNGCLEQRNGGQPAICIPSTNTCPSDYRPVYWNWGCPHAYGDSPVWRCCI